MILLAVQCHVCGVCEHFHVFSTVLRMQFTNYYFLRVLGHGTALKLPFVLSFIVFLHPRIMYGNSYICL